MPIKFLPGGTKVLRLIIAPSIKEGDCFGAYKFVAHHYANGSSQIQGIGLIIPTVQWHMLTPS